MWTTEPVKAFENLVGQTTGELFLLCPYLTLPALELVLARNRSRSLTVVTRWRTQDVLVGASNIEVYPYLQRRGATLLLHRRLHAKVAVSQAGAVISTGNVTSKGLGGWPHANVECAIGSRQLATTVLDWAKAISAQSMLVTDEMYEAFSSHLAVLGSHPLDIVPEFNFQAFASTHEADSPNSLPGTSSPRHLYNVLHRIIAGLGVDPAERSTALADATLMRLDLSTHNNLYEQMAIRYFALPTVQLLTTFLAKPRYFGEIKNWLNRNGLTRRSGRQESIEAVRTVFRWFVSLRPAEFELQRPNYSQRLVRRPR